MNFKSDNYVGVCPEIMQAIIKANEGYAGSYGADEYSKKLEKKVSEIFEHEVSIYLTSTGTATNGLALSAVAPTYSTVYCHTNAHINTDECGAPELFTGAKLTTIAGNDGKINIKELEKKIFLDIDMRPHASKPAAVSVTQLTEGGTVYTIEELSVIGQCASEYGLFMHMDGARFANALVSLGCTPAQMTWKLGVDVLSFGATKNGAMMAEMVIIFNKDLAKNFDYLQKRAGQLMSKTRFEAAQFLAYFENDLWLKNAENANKMAKRLAENLKTIPGASIDHSVDGNEIFVSMTEIFANKLEQNGVMFYSWGPGLYRFVTSWATSQKELENFSKIVLK